MKTLSTTLSACRPSVRFLGLTFLLYIIGAARPFMMAPGLSEPEPIGPYLNGILPDKTPTGTSTGVVYSLENAFPGLTFIDPVDMVEIPGTNEFLVIGLQGHIWKFANSPGATGKQLLLDISPNTVVYQDGGMLGIALHPEFGQAGSPNANYIYVFYRYTPVGGTDGSQPAVKGYMRLSRFNYVLGSNSINPNSEYVMIQVYDRHDWHNGGDMFFGPDGFLYLVVGDEGDAADSYGVTQQIDKWLFSGVLRIDVDQRGGIVSHPIRRQPRNAGTPPTGWPSSFTQGYYIPNDNPWLDPLGGILEEFFAIGTRSPHRMSYDPPTGEIWIGDVGQGAKEEVSVVRKGDNLQWPYREGDQTGFRSKPIPLIGNDKPPIYAYGRSIGAAVIGGFVYRGSRYPELYGKYFFGDHETQNVWTLEKDPAGGPPDVSFLLHVPVHGTGGKDGISSFFVDSQGNIYILDLFATFEDGGIIRKIVRTGNEIPDPPSKLSDLGVFTNMQTLETVPGIIPFDVNAPLWSDRAAKRRWIALPNDGAHDTPAEQITFDAEGSWHFPPGTVMIKHFELPVDESNPGAVARLETRFLVFTSEGDAYGVTYRWNDGETDAYLIGIDAEETRNVSVKKSDGSVVTQTWDFPSRQQCMQCHSTVAGHALGVRTRQLNKSITYPSTGITSNQLETWNHLGMFHQGIAAPDQLPASAYLLDHNSSTEMRVRSYIDANCGFCHRPNGVEGAFDGRSATALYDQNMINALVTSNASPGGMLVVKPGDASHSELWIRSNSTAANKMPPVGTRLSYPEYLDVLTAWIQNLDATGPEEITEGWYTLQARHSGMLASVENGSGSAQARIVQASPGNHAYQKWHIQPVGNGKYRMTNDHSDMVMSLVTLTTGEGSDIVQEPWSGKQHQLWYFEDTDNGFFRIQNAYNNLDSDVFSGGTDEGLRLVTWRYNGGANQQWKPVPVGVQNSPPVASAVANPASGVAPLEVTLDGSASNDADGTIVDYTWTIGNPTGGATNFVENGEFDQGLTRWNLEDYTGPNYTAGGGSATVVSNAGMSGPNSLYVDVQNANNGSWTLQVAQELSTVIENGKTYQISFEAKAQSSRPIAAVLGGRPSYAALWQQTVSLTTARQTFGPFEFTCTDNGGEQAFYFAFYLAQGVISDVWIDKVIIADVTSGSAPPNGTVLGNGQTLTTTLNEGTHHIKLTVTDDHGATDEDTVVVVVAPAGEVCGDMLPAPWVSAYIGEGNQAGEACLENNVFTVEASGKDIWGRADEFRFVHQPLDCNGEIIARVTSLENTNSSAKAGVMVRAGSHPGAMNAMMAVTPGNGLTFQYRTRSGGTTTKHPGIPGVVPKWVRLGRDGSTFTGYFSGDGINWTVAGKVTILGMPDHILAGLAVTAHTNSRVTSATFEGVSVTNCDGIARLLAQSGNQKTVGAGELPHQPSALVYPNPLSKFSQLLTVDIKNPDNEVIAYELFDIYGRTIRFGRSEGSIQQFIQFDLSGEANGILFLRISGNSWSKTERIVLN